MKIYFACSIRAGRTDQPIYAEIVETIKQAGATVLSELFGDAELMSNAHQALSKAEIWAKDLAMLREADGLIAEVTNPSLGVGYEIARAEELGKPILTLYRPSPERSLSAMIGGNPNVQLVNYVSASETQTIIEDFVRKLNAQPPKQ